MTTDLVITPGYLTILHVGSHVNETFKVHLSGSIVGPQGDFSKILILCKWVHAAGIKFAVLYYTLRFKT